MDPRKEVKSARLVCLPLPLYSKGDRGGECWHNIQINIATHDVLIVLAYYNTKTLTVVVCQLLSTSSNFWGHLTEKIKS